MGIALVDIALALKAPDSCCISSPPVGVITPAPPLPGRLCVLCLRPEELERAAASCA